MARIASRYPKKYSIVRLVLEAVIRSGVNMIIAELRRRIEEMQQEIFDLKARAKNSDRRAA
jgi:hypothetical protein